MCHLMFFPDTVPGETFLTVRAFEWFQSSVCYLMFFPVTVLGEAFLTVSAFEWFHSGIL